MHKLFTGIVKLFTTDSHNVTYTQRKKIKIKRFLYLIFIKRKKYFLFKKKILSRILSNTKSYFDKNFKIMLHN